MRLAMHRRADLGAGGGERGHKAHCAAAAFRTLGEVLLAQWTDAVSIGHRHLRVAHARGGHTMIAHSVESSPPFGMTQ